MDGDEDEEGRNGWEGGGGIAVALLVAANHESSLRLTIGAVCRMECLDQWMLGSMDEWLSDQCIFGLFRFRLTILMHLLDQRMLGSMEEGLGKI